MATAFTSLPFVDLSVLSSPAPSTDELERLSGQLNHVFSTTGFAYLVNAPLTFSHDEVFELAKDFFRIDAADKMRLTKRSFESTNNNTYRGYFPAQPGHQDNLKEGFEIGSPHDNDKSATQNSNLNLTEPNVWPEESSFPRGRSRLEKLYHELQALSSTLLALLAVSLRKPPEHFSSYLTDSISTIRLLHYPPQDESAGRDKGGLCCTPHTDSGILTLLHQDPTGGLEVLNASGDWVPAPYVAGSIVVNIGDLLAKVSGGRFVATMHRVRASSANRADGFGRFSVPFFFEPGEHCIVQDIDTGESVVYGEHVRQKMGTWVEFQEAAEPARMQELVCSA